MCMLLQTFISRPLFSLEYQIFIFQSWRIFVSLLWLLLVLKCFTGTSNAACSKLYLLKTIQNTNCIYYYLFYFSLSFPSCTCTHTLPFSVFSLLVNGAAILSMPHARILVVTLNILDQRFLSFPTNK